MQRQASKLPGAECRHNTGADGEYRGSAACLMAVIRASDAGQPRSGLECPDSFCNCRRCCRNSTAAKTILKSQATPSPKFGKRISGSSRWIQRQRPSGSLWRSSKLLTKRVAAFLQPPATRSRPDCFLFLLSVLVLFFSLLDGSCA